MAGERAGRTWCGGLRRRAVVQGVGADAVFLSGWSSLALALAGIAQVPQLLEDSPPGAAGRRGVRGRQQGLLLLPGEVLPGRLGQEDALRPGLPFVLLVGGHPHLCCARPHC